MALDGARIPMQQTFVSLDLEMTGLRPEGDSIIEIAAIKFRVETDTKDGKDYLREHVLEQWSTLVNPRCTIPLKIQVLTGITQQEVDRAPLLNDVVGQLVRFVGNHPIVGQSIANDIGYLQRSGIYLTNPLVDTFEMASILLPQMDNYSLSGLAEYLEAHAPPETRHRALGDARTTMGVFMKLLNRANDLPIQIIEEINRLMQRNHTWTLGGIFRELQKDRMRSTWSGTSIREQLQAKLGAIATETSLDTLFQNQKPRAALQQARQETPVDTGELSAMLQPGGRMSQYVVNYEYRPQQVEMMRAVAEVFNRKEHLVVEAGTGTGKSLAYLLPAIYHAVQNGEHVVISTSTINLQDQLYNKDLPALQRVLPVDFKYALLKGRSNYLCPRRWTALRKSEVRTEEENRTLVKVLCWLPQTQTGDRAELNLQGDEQNVWHKIAANADYCPPLQCSSHQRTGCFIHQARNSAEGAHIIIVNHALLLSDLASEHRVLPEYRYLIIDEAHNLEEEATDQFGWVADQRAALALLDDLSQDEPGIPRHQSNGKNSVEWHGGFLGRLRVYMRANKITQALQKELDELSSKVHTHNERIRPSVTSFFGACSQFLHHHGEQGSEYDRRLRITRKERNQQTWSTVESAWEPLSLQLTELESVLEKIGQKLFELDAEELLSEVSLLNRTCTELRQHLNTFVFNPDSEFIYWIEQRGYDSSIALHAVPLHVGRLLEETLFATKESVVLTSATLSAGGSFDYIRERLGVGEAQTLHVGSPFDYKRSTLLVVPQDIPEPNRPGYQKAVQDTLVNLCSATEGRTLALFTSHSAVRATLSAIRPALEANGILVLGQGVDGSRRQLLQTFKTNPRTVLLGTSSFWEGVDIVGDALSVLVIAKLPFAVPNDPVFAARSEMFDDPFNEYSVPQTILKFKQGFGRLIRSARDRGIVVILDRRVQTKAYGRQFLESLPGYTPYMGRDNVTSNIPRIATNWLQQK